MSLVIEPPPFQTPIADRRGQMEAAWSNWLLLALLKRLEAATYALVTVALTDQAASIGTTALIPAAQAGRYRVSWYVRVTQAAAVSSDFTVTITSTDGTIPVSQSGATEAGNTTATVQSGSVIVRADSGSPVSYAVAYNSVGAPAMAFAIDVVVESIG